MDHLDYLKQNSLSAALFDGDAPVASSADHGVLPMLRFFREGAIHGRTVADKVVGRAAASLAVIGGAERVFAAVGSDCGAAVLEAAGVPCFFAERVPIIRTPAGDICPMERLTEGSADAAEAVARIEAFFAAKGS